MRGAAPALHRGIPMSLSRLSFRTTLELAIAAMRAHKLRSSLTLLGIVAGVSSVVVVAGIIEGLNLYAAESTSRLFGSEAFYVAQVGTASSWQEFALKVKRNKRIGTAEYEFLRTMVGAHVLHSPFLVAGATVRRHGATTDAPVLGVASSMAEIRNIDLEEGRFFSEQEEDGRRNVAVIGEDVRSQLFPRESPIGQSLQVNGAEFVVVGVQQKRGSAFGASQDNLVYVPFGAHRRLFRSEDNMLLYARARPESGLSLSEALDLTRAALRVRLHLRPSEEDRFEVVTPEGLRSSIGELTDTIAAVAIPVTGIALLVAGIGVANVMLICVSERVHEIGILKSVGARRVDIRRQFLSEAMILCLAGGSVGIGLAFLLLKIFSHFSEAPTSVPFHYVAAAIGLSSLIGILSGWYPAVAAARLDAIQALRAE